MFLHIFYQIFIASLFSSLTDFITHVLRRLPSWKISSFKFTKLMLVFGWTHRGLSWQSKWELGSSNVCVNIYQAQLVLERGGKPVCPWDWGCSPSKAGCKCKGKEVLGKRIDASFGELKELHSKTGLLQDHTSLHMVRKMCIAFRLPFTPFHMC